MTKADKKKIEALKDNPEALAFMVRECNGWDQSLDSYEVHEFDDEFFDTYFEGKAMEAVRATFFGDIQNWNDEYIRFNGYGNLESLNDFSYNAELRDGADEIIQRFIELADEKNAVDTKYLLKEYAQ